MATKTHIALAELAEAAEFALSPDGAAVKTAEVAGTNGVQTNHPWYLWRRIG